MPGASEPDPVSTKQQQIAELAKQSPQMGFTSLNHHIDLRWLYEAYMRVRPDAAPGVDGQTVSDYNANLRGNLESLLERAKSGTYWAPPVRRVYIPKGTGPETRPIGIPTFEDKILQRAVVMVLEAVYEQDFYNCSYGFRPGRSAHQALDELWQRTMRTQGGWIVEVDIRKSAKRCVNSVTRCSGLGGRGCHAERVATFPGTSSTGCWGVTRCQRRL
jgi:RNA-directed DNA polymerase